MVQRTTEVVDLFLLSLVTSVILNGQFDLKKSAQAKTDSVAGLLTLSKKNERIKNDVGKNLRKLFSMNF